MQTVANSTTLTRTYPGGCNIDGTQYYTEEELANRKEEDEIPLALEVTGTEKKQLEQAEEAM